MNTNTIKIYEILKEAWGETKATTVINYLESETELKVGKEVKANISNLATKEDLYRLESLVSDKYANTIKWLFVFWLGTVGTIIAIIKLL